MVIPMVKSSRQRRTRRAASSDHGRTPAAMAASRPSRSCDTSGDRAHVLAALRRRDNPDTEIDKLPWRSLMAKEELLEFEGVVTEVLPDGNYRVKLDNDHEVLAYMSGKMRKFRIRTGVGDKVVVEMSPYDLDRGRINFRHRDTNRPLGAPPTRRQQTVRRR